MRWLSEDKREDYQNCSVLYCLPQLYQLYAHSYEQFLQVGLLNRALISLGLALSPPSTSVSLDFMVLCKCSLKVILTSLYLVDCRGLGLVGLALYLVDWPTIVLQCFVTVGWVIWPVKIVPDMTYSVFGGMLNPTLLLLLLGMIEKVFCLCVVNTTGSRLTCQSICFRQQATLMLLLLIQMQYVKSARYVGLSLGVDFDCHSLFLQSHLLLEW